MIAYEIRDGRLRRMPTEMLCLGEVDLVDLKDIGVSVNGRPVADVTEVCPGHYCVLEFTGRRWYVP